MADKKKYYAVSRGYRTGIYTTWFGDEGAEVQVHGFPGASYKGFATRDEAEKWLKSPDTWEGAPHEFKGETRFTGRGEESSPVNMVNIYTDGGCSGNPGPGGWGAVILDGDSREELSGGYRLTTNNRMELMACIRALEVLSGRQKLSLYSDSRYVVQGIAKGWARKWQSQNWMRTKTERAENVDLWSHLLHLCDRHQVTFVWVKGHACHPENERCDKLATTAAMDDGLLEDVPYVEGNTHTPAAIYHPG